MCRQSYESPAVSVYSIEPNEEIMAGGGTVVTPSSMYVETNPAGGFDDD